MIKSKSKDDMISERRSTRLILQPRRIAAPSTEQDVKTGGERHCSCSKKHRCTIKPGCRKFCTAKVFVEISVSHEIEGGQPKLGCLQKERDT